MPGAVGGDMLPEADQWDDLLAPAGLSRNTFHDREDLFFLQATLKN